MVRTDRHQHAARQPDGELVSGRSSARSATCGRSRLHNDAIAYNANDIQRAAEFRPAQHQVNAARAQPQAALDFRWPFMRDSGAWGTAADRADRADRRCDRRPATARSTSIRTRTALTSNSPTPTCSASTASRRSTDWTAACAPMSRCRRLVSRRHDIRRPDRPILSHQATTCFPEASGLHDQVSDVVARASFSPTSWLNLTYRTRLDHKRSCHPHGGCARHRRRAEILGEWRLYLHDRSTRTRSIDQPTAAARRHRPSYTPRNEITRRSVVELGQLPVQRLGPARSAERTRWWPSAPTRSTRTNAIILDFRFYRRYTSYNGDMASTTALIQMTFKTIGQFGFKAL